VVDLNSPFTKPFFWNLIPKPPLASPTDIVLYELHIRDFSISDKAKLAPADASVCSAIVRNLKDRSGALDFGLGFR
jgi:pullulanase/glycogen debranching enzyme